jgi:hypothetical protein
MSRPTFVALVFECHDWGIIAGDPRKRLVRLAHHGDEQTSGFEELIGLLDRRNVVAAMSRGRDLDVLPFRETIRPLALAPLAGLTVLACLDLPQAGRHVLIVALYKRDRGVRTTRPRLLVGGNPSTRLSSPVDLFLGVSRAV